MFVVEIATTKDGTAKAITEKTNFIEAEMLFHQIMASMMANQDVSHGICTVINDDGRQSFELTREFTRIPTE